jgi:hypothetical protein
MCETCSVITKYLLNCFAATVAVRKLYVLQYGCKMSKADLLKTKSICPETFPALLTFQWLVFYSLIGKKLIKLNVLTFSTLSQSKC